MEALTAQERAYQEALLASLPDPTYKVAIRFKPIGRAPILKQQVYKISAAQPFESVSNFLKRQLGKKDQDQLVWCKLGKVLPSLIVAVYIRE